MGWFHVLNQQWGIMDLKQSAVPVPRLLQKHIPNVYLDERRKSTVRLGAVVQSQWRRGSRYVTMTHFPALKIL